MKTQGLVPCVTNPSGAMVLASTAGYSAESSGISAGAYLAKTCDQDDYETKYSYNVKTGNLNSVTNVNGTTTSYTYDANNDALKSVTTNGITNSYTYDNSRLKTIAHNGMNYSFNYDVFGNVTQTKAGNYILSTNTYAANNGKLTKTTYGNGYYTTNNYNNFGQVTSVAKNGSTKYSWTYDASTKPIYHKDYENKLTYYYTYDTTGRLVRSNVYKQGINSNTDSRVYTVEQNYDKNNNVSKFVQSTSTDTVPQYYSYGKDNLPTEYTMFSDRKQTYTFDNLNRYSHMELSLEKPVVVDYNYYLSKRNKDGEEKYRTTKPGWEFLNNTVYKYSFDKLGNITTIDQGERVGDKVSGQNYSNKLTYEYDVLQQLTRENNKYLNQTITYTYDKGGNITAKKIYPYTTGSLSSVTPTQTISYTYGNSSWTDLLTAYNGKSITYDAIGNPTSYLGYTLKWNGRQLSSLSGNGTTASYKYDADGLRSYKKVGNVESTYQYVGDKLMYEKRGTTEFYYYYNSLGQLSGIKYYLDGTQYMVYAICNTRGDVVDLYWGSGNLACHYTYDSWGNMISVTNADGNEITNQNNIGHLNPIRYRGYYYDSETGFYYLQTRYYDPEICRCINADTSDVLTASPKELTDKNLFAYCDNNPVSRADGDGEFWHVVIGAAVGAVVGVAGQVISDAVTSLINGEFSVSNWQTYVGAFVGGALGGAVLGATGNVNLANAVTGCATTGVGLGLEKLTHVSDKSWVEIGANAVVDGAVSFGLGKLPGIPKITKGRNNMNAVYRSGLTRLRNGTARRMSSKVIWKGIGSSFFGGLAMDGYYGVKQHAYDRVRGFLIR